MSDLIQLPILPLRDVVVYPHMVIPLFVGREKSINALNAAMENEEKQILLVAQKQASEDDPKDTDLYDVGTLATILQLLKLPDGTVKVLVEGTDRATVESIIQSDPYFLADAQYVEIDEIEADQVDALIRTVNSQFEKYVKLNKKIPPEVVASVGGITDGGRLADTISAHMSLKIVEKQNMLALFGLRERLERLIGLMEAEIDLFQVEHRIRSNVKRQMEKSQREYYLNEQLKAIHKELGDDGNEVDELKKKIKAAGMTKEAKEKALSELSKLQMMPPMSAEATVCRNYLDWMLGVPWKKRSQTKLEIKEAELVLNTEHFGLEKVKERILEYLAVQKRVKKLKGPVLCLVGPPGVGKTSLAQSIANATKRKYVRFSLGGVRDEAEIRGHRRTYIGAMPGKIIQKLAKAEVKNPLFLLDEIDKMAMDVRGDPASALLEVLDPEQNSNFNDHYLEVDFDLSDVMFVATANSLDMPAALRDRMEIIQLSGYTEDEKLHIANDYLIPKQIEANGVKPEEISFTDASVLEMVRYYTRESGVRSLEREIAKVSRKVVKDVLSEEDSVKVIVSPDNIEQYLGVRKYRYGCAESKDQVGQVTGLAWTEVGGDLLTIEAVVVPGKGKVLRTGKLGDVMLESIQAAVTVVRARSAALGIEDNFAETKDIHFHVPEGATPKDGPSAGAAMCVALVSSLTKIPIRSDVAMTGEITLRGEVLPIGGLKEKLLAAKRGGIRQVIIPEENRRNLKEIPENIKSELEITCVRWIDDVLQIALSQPAEPLSLDSVPDKEDREDEEQGASASRH